MGWNSATLNSDTTPWYGFKYSGAHPFLRNQKHSEHTAERGANRPPTSLEIVAVKPPPWGYAPLFPKGTLWRIHAIARERCPKLIVQLRSSSLTDQPRRQLASSMWWTWAAQGYLKSIGVYQATFDESLAIRAEGIVIYSLIQLPLGQSALGDYAWDMWEVLTAFTCGFAPMTAQAQPATHAVSGLYLGLNSSANLLPDADISRS